MRAKLDLLLRNAKLRDSTGDLVDIGIAQGNIAAIDNRIERAADTEIDARGNLVTESFVNPHLHLCKVYTLRMMQEDALRAYQGEGMGEAMAAIELAARVKEKYDESWIIENVRQALAQAVLHGCTHVRGFADVDGRARLEGVKALLTAREEFSSVLQLQVVAFAQDGVVREPPAIGLLEQALELGADVIGGIPWIEYTEADMREHVRLVFDLAERFNVPVSMLVDDAGDPGLRTVEMMAAEAIHRGWHGRALAHHARAMGLYPRPYLHKVIALLRQSDMGVVSDPHTGPLHAPVRDLLEAGILVCLGQDDITDAYYPYGRNSQLEVAFLASHLLWMTTAAEMEALYDMITVNPARAIGLADFRLAVGSPANLVVLRESNLLEALRTHAEPVHVISQGALVDRERMRALAADGSRPLAE